MISKSKIIKVLQKLKSSHCRCNGNKCLCQFGGNDIDNAYYWGFQKGAPEIGFCIDLLEKMKETEIRKILKR